MNTLEEFYLMESFDAIAYKDYLRQIKAERFVLSYNLIENEKIIRARINDNDKLFKNTSEISYPPVEKARLDRPSLAGYPMFYGSIFTHVKGQVYLPRIINIMETSALFKDKQSVGTQWLTYSVWTTCRKLNLAILPISLTYKQPCDEVLQIQREVQDIIDLLGVAFYNEAIFLSDLFARENKYNTYAMTANFVDYLLNDSDGKDYFDGILYPSVPSEGLGLNICVRPTLIDDNIIKCGGASTMLLIKDKMNSKVSQFFDADIADNGELLWHNSKMLNKAIVNPELFPELLYI